MHQKLKAHAPRWQAATAAIATGLLALTMASCGTSTSQSSSVSTGPELPQLTTAEDVRDQIARAESAISHSSETMGALATECVDCRELFQSVTGSATKRLTLAGGLWDPWPNTADSSVDSTVILPEPPQVGNAPETPAGLVGYMLKTAKEQLEAIAECPDFPGDEATALAAIIGGRIASARTITTHYKLDDSAVVAALPSNASSTSVGESSVQVSPETAVAQSGETGGVDLGEVLSNYDCLGTTFGLSQLAVDNSTVQMDIYNRLLERASIIVGGGQVDVRTVRCVLADRSVDSLFNDLVATDLTLLAASDQPTRELGVKYLLQDISAWLNSGSSTPNDITVGLARIGDNQ